MQNVLRSETLKPRYFFDLSEILFGMAGWRVAFVMLYGFLLGLFVLIITGLWVACWMLVGRKGNWRKEGGI